MAVGPVAFCWVPCLFESETSRSTSLEWCPGTVRKGSKRTRRVERGVDLGCCGRRAVKRCIGAKETREGARAEMQPAKGDDRRIGIPRYSLTHTDVLHGGSNTAFNQLSGSSRGPGTRCAVCADRTTAVDCAAGMPGRTPGGRRIEVMRAVASSADEVALRSHNRRLVRRLHAGPAQRLVFRGRFGE
jgi:hypothetical protein